MKPLIATLVLALMPIAAAHATQFVVTLNPSDIMHFYSNTTKNVGPANIAVLEVNSGLLSGGCVGVFVDTVADKSTYAMLLSAVVSQKSITIDYDTQIPSPWGNAAWCGLIYAGLTP